MSEASIYETERRDKLEKLRALGVDPYGGRTAGVAPHADVRALHKPEFGQDGGPVVTISGRVMFRKSFGKLTFITLRDETGDMQAAIDKKRVSETDWQVHDLVDLGDQIVVTGKLGATKTGEVTVWATNITFAAKALLPPPAKWEGLSDVELRYRQRYVDLWANPDVMRTLKLRMRIVEEVRSFLKARGYTEVETPMMQAIAGGAAARPFVTHHRALDIPLYMRIAPELYLKRLLVGGFTKVFELNRNFRNEGISPRHNPEFTMLEAYEAFGSWETMAEMVEGMICHIAQTVFGTLKLEHKNADGTVRKTINLEGDTSKPAGQRWRRVSMADLVEERTGWKFTKDRASAPDVSRIIATNRLRMIRSLPQRVRMTNPNLAARLAQIESVEQFDRESVAMRALIGEEHKRIREILSGLLPAAEKASNAEIDQTQRAVNELEALQGDYLKLIDKTATRVFEDQFLYKFMTLSPAEQLTEVYEKFVEPTLSDPTFVTHVPSVIIPLARKSKDDPFFADVYELAINGQEISPGYSELNDPEVQAANFTQQVGDKDEQQKVDDDFLTALKYGMPPAGGMGLGIDRLVMMLTGAESIRDVILFPLMKPQDKGATPPPPGIEAEQASPT
ncbi:MAG TPA: amino acid--tRNA ligase-related protein [Tepidisphaeraceae bacterium]|nr:amino acid--tRNA ligase-related protein [Tepidisphaeraceae bacterium]